MKIRLVNRLIAFTFPILLIAPVCAAESGEQIKADTPIRDKWALVVGIGKFQDAKIPELKYAAKDARDFRDFLVKEANFAPDHVRLLVDEQATQRRVLSELGNKFLARVAKPDDLVVIYCSSHGSPAQADIRGDNFVVAHDSDPEDLFSTGIEMDKILDSIDARVLSQRVLLVLDACHSGVVTKGAKGIRRSGNFDAQELAQGSGQLVITSSAPDQISWESKRYQNGIFTRKLLEALRVNGTKTTLGDAFPYVEKAVSAEVQEDYASRQNPIMKSKWNGNALVLAMVPAAPQALPVAVKQILEPDSTIARKPAAKPGLAANTLGSLPASNAGLALTAVLPSNAVSGGNSYEKGIAMYNKGDYASSITTLKAAIQTGGQGNRADAHFTLANAYVKLNKISDALTHYRESFRLSPHGKKADYCLQMITYYSKQPSAGGRATTSLPAASITTSVPSATSGSLTSTNSNLTSSTQSNSAVSGASSYSVPAGDINRVRASLPRIKQGRPATPFLSEILNWSLQERANYLGEAANRVEDAQQNYRDSEELLKKAKSLCYSLIPNGRAYGETEDAFKVRREAQESVFKELLVPYQKDIDLRNKYLTDESAILQACQAAQRELAPVGVVKSGSSGGTTTTSTTPCK
jgi:uncharacterized caspase-like protein